MKHGVGSAWVIYYCCLCKRYFLESSAKCELCKIGEPAEECCHYGDAEVEIKFKKVKE